MDKPLSRDLLFDFKTATIVYHPDCSQRITGGVNAVTALKLSIGVSISENGPGSPCGSDEQILLGWLVGLLDKFLWPF